MRLSDPSDRNFEIFSDVEQGGVSLRAAAAKHGLSVGRIQQIVAQVRQWFRAIGFNEALHIGPHGMVIEGFYRLEDRLRYLYQESMAAWRDSKGEFAERREGRAGTTVTTARSFGDVRYLGQAMRIAVAQQKALNNHWQHLVKTGVIKGPSTIATSPPVEVYAPSEQEEEEVVEATPEAPAATANKEPTCDTFFESVLAPEPPAIEIPNPMRSRLAKKLARHEKRKAARDRKRSRQLA